MRNFIRKTQLWFIAALIAAVTAGCATGDRPEAPAAGEKTAQKVRTPFLGGWDQVPNERLERQADKYRGTYYLEGLGHTKRIALTFDDGPSVNTPYLLKVLDKHGVKATFFWLGQWVEQNPDIARAAYAAGHTLGNHSYSHPYLTRIDPRQAWDGEIDRTQAAFERIVGVAPVLVRPPYGYLEDSQVESLREKGYKAILWSIDTQDWYVAWTRDLNGGATIAKKVTDHLHGEAIVLMHDGGGARHLTIQAVDQLIPALKAQGYRFVTVDQLIGVKPYR
jgi:peptidoglycan-N-acetylglucosamine deacetylase